MRIFALLTFVVIYLVTELKAENELPAVISRDPFAFLEKSSKTTKDEYIRLYQDRQTPRNELQKKKDELIAKESEEIQKLYKNQKKFEADRKAHQRESHLLRLSGIKDTNFRHFTDKAYEIINDDSLSLNQACDRIVLLKYHSGSDLSDHYIRVYDCKPLKEESKPLKIGGLSDFEI